MNIASDLEGTLTTGVIGLTMSHYVRDHGRRLAYNLFVARQLIPYAGYKTGLVEGDRFKNNWLAGVLRFFEGYSVEQFAEVSDWVVERVLWPQRRPEVIAELKRHQDEEHRVVITSGGFAPIAENFANRAGIAESIGTPVEIINGHLTGKVRGRFNTSYGKAENLMSFFDGTELDIAYGDTEADIQMLTMSRQPVAVYPDDKLRQHALQHGWRIIDAGSDGSE